MADLPAGFRWLPGMVSTDGRYAHNVDGDVLFYGRGLDYGACRIDDPTLAPKWCGQTNGVLLDEVRRLNPGWFAISCQYSGSEESWRVIARAEGYGKRHEHAILGVGVTEELALCAALAAAEVK